MLSHLLTLLFPLMYSKFEIFFLLAFCARVAAVVAFLLLEYLCSLDRAVEQGNKARGLKVSA